MSELKGQRVNDVEQPGDFKWMIVSMRSSDGQPSRMRPIAENERPTHLIFMDRNGVRHSVSIRPEVQANGHSWDWDGNLGSPSLHPSIHATGIWHGWLRKGVFVDA